MHSLELGVYLDASRDYPLGSNAFFFTGLMVPLSPSFPLVCA